MQAYEIIKLLETDNSRLFKEGVLRDHQSNEEFTLGCKLALDYLVSFGVKQVPTATSNGKGLSWEQFNELASKLQNRTATGHAARDAILDAMNDATADEWNYWYRRILIKDLRCGVSQKTVNNVTPGTVPVFTCMLAHDSQNHEKKMTGEKQIEVKLDGVRVITVVKTNGDITMFSRNGKQFHNFQHIIDDIRSKAHKVAYDYVIDGEVMSNSFQDLMKQVHRKDGKQSQDAVLHAFDYIPLEDFLAGSYSATQRTRTAKIQELVEVCEFDFVETLDYEIVNLDTEQGVDRFKEINKSAVEGGYEGVMIKELDKPYECKRSHSWLKAKPFIEVTLEVKSLEEGTGRNLGVLGAFVCEGMDDGKHIRVNVGSGLSDSARSDIWPIRDSVVGQLIEVRADAITQNQDGSYSMRFPRFKSFRGFEIGEKI
jgi:DNA ligase-1